MMKKSTFGAILAFLFAAAGALTAAALYLRRREKELRSVHSIVKTAGTCVARRLTTLLRKCRSLKSRNRHTEAAIDLRRREKELDEYERLLYSDDGDDYDDDDEYLPIDNEPTEAAEEKAADDAE